MNYGNFMREFKVTSKLSAYVLPEGFELRLTIFAGKPVDVEGYPPVPNGYVRAGNHSAAADNCCPLQALIKDY
jgi:hypothetical protein